MALRSLISVIFWFICTASFFGLALASLFQALRGEFYFDIWIGLPLFLALFVVLSGVGITCLVETIASHRVWRHDLHEAEWNRKTLRRGKAPSTLEPGLFVCFGVLVIAVALLIMIG